jgi:hypothetical protein
MIHILWRMEKVEPTLNAFVVSNDCGLKRVQSVRSWNNVVKPFSRLHTRKMGVRCCISPLKYITFIG